MSFRDDGWLDRETGERAPTMHELIMKKVDRKPVPWYKEAWFQVCRFFDQLWGV